MVFVPRTQLEILDDMVTHIQANTPLSDLSVGSIIRTILEAAAIEDAEQYFQMVQLLNAFSVSKARGANLNERLAEFGLSRQASTSAITRLRYQNNNATTSLTVTDAVSTDVTLILDDSSDFPSSGTVRIGEGGSTVIERTIISNNIPTNTLTFSAALGSAFATSSRVTLITGNTLLINSDSKARTAETVTSSPKVFTTQEDASIAPGNYYSNSVLAVADTPGTGSNTGVNTIVQIVGTPPFNRAGVTNITAAEGGQDTESDFNFRRRGLDHIQSLSRGTPLALKSAALGIVDDSTGQTVTSANVIEDFQKNEVIVYIDDGSGFVPDTESLPQASLSASVSVGGLFLPFTNTEKFSSEGEVLVLSGTSTELVKYVSKTSTTLILDTSTPLVFAHVGGDIVRTVEILTDSAESGQQRLSIKQSPIVRGNFFIYRKNIGPVSPSNPWVLQVEDTDFQINKGTGEVIFTDLAGLSQGDEVVISYAYFTNLVALVQKTLEGDEDDPSNFPGFKAAGTVLSVEPPVIRRITVNASITAERGFTETDVAPGVQAAIESFINNLKIGDDVILVQLIGAAREVEGLRDIVFSTPTGNIPILENELPVPFTASGTTLVTVI